MDEIKKIKGEVAAIRAENYGEVQKRSVEARIKDKVLNLIELNDLYYHAIVIEQLIEILKTNPNMFNTAAANDGDNNDLAGNQSMDGSE